MWNMGRRNKTTFCISYIHVLLSCQMCYSNFRHCTEPGFTNKCFFLLARTDTARVIILLYRRGLSPLSRFAVLLVIFVVSSFATSVVDSASSHSLLEVLTFSRGLHVVVRDVWLGKITPVWLDTGSSLGLSILRKRGRLELRGAECVLQNNQLSTLQTFFL